MELMSPDRANKQGTKRAGIALLPELELLERAREGEEAAFEGIMRRHNQRLFRTARSILRNDGEAEDVVQETYLRAFLHLERFAGESSLGTWLVRIAVNESLGRLRRRSPLAGSEPLESADLLGGRSAESPGLPGAPEADDPERSAARAELRRLVEEAIDALPDGFRTVFVLRGLEGLSVEETAASLGIPEATVKTRYHRARRNLRKALMQRVEPALAGSFPFAGARCDRIVASVLARLAGAPPAL